MKQSAAILLLVIFFHANPVFPQSDSMPAQDTLPLTVLIAMGTSYLEQAVSAIVKDSLEVRGYQVAVVNIETLGARNRSDYRAVILFSAVKSSELTPAARKFVRSQEGPGPESNILICDVGGEAWNGGREEVDAVAAATVKMRPDETAARVLANFYNIVGRK